MRWDLFLLGCAFAPSCSAERALHWVIRVSSLEETLAFTTDVLNMTVLRHEENAEPCPLTCNGVFDTPWSKTMVGYGPEDSHYALELTYNYGIAAYERGAGLQRFVIRMENPFGALDAARAKGYAVDQSIVTGPDGYMYELVQGGRVQQEFDAVVLKAADPAALAAWYARMIGMTSEPLAHGAHRVGFKTSGMNDFSNGFVIEPTADGGAPRIEQWEGRNAIALPETTLRAINERIKAEAPSLIIHEMRELHEKLGTLFIVILRDVAGYEVCLVSIETFDPSVREATNYVGPDWGARKETLEHVQGLQALADARQRMFEQMQGSSDEGNAEDEGEGDDEDDEDDEDEDDDESPKDEV